ncbi:helix-turn-helix domain-containing protein [Verrucomicrobium sp. BvORR106]|uniref:helix-turn-helix domain-containing protein n=1 Tax=Verrucomicrobium sp. BvORR106 TaxID=1403819 RepID=UPI0009E0572A|nr:helix-turn-helix domain-containing protein [Verrucomicrobium sp. BvORR106]
MSPTLGQQLRRARELQYLTLADLAHETRIPASRLRDLENDEYTTFGGVAYVRLFLKAYSARLEVDAGEALARLSPPLPPQSKLGLSWLRRTPDWVLPSAFARRRTRNPGKADVARDPMGRELKAMAMVCAITLLLGASYLVAQAYQQNREETPAPAATPPALDSSDSTPSGSIEVRRAGTQVSKGAAPSVSPPKAIPVGPEPPVVKAELVK